MINNKLYDLTMGNYQASNIYIVKSEGIDTDEDVKKSFNLIFKDGYNEFCAKFRACEGHEISNDNTLIFVKDLIGKLPYNSDFYIAQEIADFYNDFTNLLERNRYLMLKTTINLDGELLIKTQSGQEISVDDAISFINDHRIYEEAMESFDEHKKELEGHKS